MFPDNFDPGEAQQGKGYAVLSYLGFLFIIPILAAKNNRFAMYHANQGLLLFIANMIFGAIGQISYIGFIGNLGLLLCFLLMVYGLINAAQGFVKELPLIGGIVLIKSY